MRTLDIVGAGHVARTLGALFAQGQVFALQDVAARSHASAAAACEFIGAGRACDGIAALHAADVYMLAVPDNQIAPVAQALAAAVPVEGAVVFHLSGATPSSELHALRAAGAHVASVHPVRSFADPAAAAAGFAGTWCGVEGDADALAVLEPAFAAIGARTVRIDPAAKSVYHAASVFASNYLVTVLDAALRAYAAAGIEEATARELLRTLADGTLHNVVRMGAPAALSGPIARGDFDTVARQQAALSAWDAPTGALYAALAEATTLLAARKRR